MKLQYSKSNAKETRRIRLYVGVIKPLSLWFGYIVWGSPVESQNLHEAWLFFPEGSHSLPLTEGFNFLPSLWACGPRLSCHYTLSFCCVSGPKMETPVLNYSFNFTALGLVCRSGIADMNLQYLLALMYSKFLNPLNFQSGALLPMSWTVSSSQACQ